jgi:hypothetical protein
MMTELNGDVTSVSSIARNRDMETLAGKYSDLITRRD